MRILIGVLLFTSAMLGQAGNRIALPSASRDEARQPAEVLLAASLNAHGGANLHGIQRIVLRGTSTAAAASAKDAAAKVAPYPITVWATMDGSSRVDWGQPVRTSTIITPERRHDVRDGKIVDRPAHSGLYTTLDLFSVLAVRNTFGSGANRGIVGDLQTKGATVRRVHVGTDRQKTYYGRVLKDEADVDFDPDTGLVAAIHRRDHGDDSLDFIFVMTSVFSDYRNVDGVLLPFRIERLRNGKPTNSITVETYELNPVFEPTLFAR